MLYNRYEKEQKYINGVPASPSEYRKGDYLGQYDFNSIKDLTRLKLGLTIKGIRILREAGMQEITMDEVINKIMFYLRKRAGDNLRIECIMYSNDFGLLAQSAGAKELLERLL